MIKKIVLVAALSFSGSLLANDDAHFEAALAVVNMPKGEQLESLVMSLVDTQVNTNPSIRPVRKAFEAFYRETFQSTGFSNGLAEIQMELFTYEELLEIKEMMSLPIFKKYEEIMPEYMSRNMQLGQQVVMANQERLKELIEKEHKRIERLQELDSQMNLTGPE